MKALLFKEFKLAVHPICWLFIAIFPIFVLLPGMGGIYFMYILCCYPILFLGANKGQQSNDLLYTSLLPVRKKDIVAARMLTTMVLTAIFIAISVIELPIGFLLQNESTLTEVAQGNPEISLGLEFYPLTIGFALIGLGISNILFFAFYYRNGKSIVLSSLTSILFFALFMSFISFGFPILCQGFLRFIVDNNWIQFAVLGGSILAYLGLNYAAYKIGSNLLEKVDF